ncbi:hypothetical protein [Promicromonospora sp. NPDC050262]|uniref:hypothetical protein n=1 Tax=Promicromonospora sp. NPDC050262 TaxID=3155036 RepID=UPI0033FC75D9
MPGGRPSIRSRCPGGHHPRPDLPLRGWRGGPAGARREVGGSPVPESPRIRRRVAAVVAALTLSGTLLVPGAVAAEYPEAMAAGATAASADYESVTLSSTPETWTAVRSGAPDDVTGFSFDDDRFVGQCVGEGGAGCGADDVQRVVYDFGDLGSPDDLADLEDGVIRSAYLTVNVMEDQDCGIRNVAVHPATAVTESSTWATSNLYTSAFTRLADVPCGGDQEVRIDVADILKYSLLRDRPLSFGLKAVDEDCRGCGRASFGSEAGLDVVLDMTDTVTERVLASASVPCVVGDDRPAIRLLEPRMSAVLTNDREPFPTAMSAIFTVRDLTTGAEIQRTETSPKASGSPHTVTINTGLLAHGGNYSWSVQTPLPSGRVSEAVNCEFSVDIVPPGVPTITPVEGYPALYERSATSGGPYVPGAFSLSADGDDIAYFRYEFSTGARGEILPGELLEFLPEASGAVQLTVRAVDDAGSVAVAPTYTFFVGLSATVGRWLFNEGTGVTTADETAGENLTLSDASLWGPGYLAEIDPADFGLVLDSPADTAASSRQIVDPTGVLTVSAVVNPADAGAGRVVSQGSDFELAVATSPECPTATGTCWAFTVATGVGAEQTTVYADAEPVPGVWNTVTAIRNPYVGDVRMYFCQSDVAEAPRRVAQTAVDPLGVESGAPLVVGGSDWSGTVDHLRILAGAPDARGMLRWCNGSTGS